MKALKHIGRMKNTGAKVLVVFRTLPGESNSALVIPVANLPDQYHDALMTLVETDQAQEAFELGEIMFVRPFPDGRPMLQAMQADSRLHKVATDMVTMTPTTNDSVDLSQLNVLIAEQKNCAIDDLYTFVKGAPRKNNSTQVEDVVKVTDLSPMIDTDIPSPLRAQAADSLALSDIDLAKSYRSQADTMYKEAARLRREADGLDPPAKKITRSKEEVSV